MCHSQRSEKIFLFTSKWVGFGSNRGSRPDIGKQREHEKEEARTRERRMRAEKITIPKDVCSGKWISRPLQCVHRGNFYWFSVSSDSQRSFHPHTSPSPLNPTFLFSDHLPPSFSSYHPVAARSPFAFCSPTSRPKWFFRITVPLSSASHFWPLPLFSLYVSLSLRCTASFLFSGDSRLGKRRSRAVPKLAQWISNKWIHLGKFQFPMFACGNVSRILVTSHAFVWEFINWYDCYTVCFAWLLWEWIILSKRVACVQL